MHFTHLSRHAYKRMMQGTQLSYRDLTNAIDRRLAVHTGNEPGFPREHLVFYSVKDDACFVAVRGKRTGEVITVLPLEYHTNLA